MVSANHTDLVALETSLTSMEGKIDIIDGVLDNSLVKQTNLETLITAGNVDLAALEVLQTSTNSLLTTLDGVQDNVLTKLTGIDTDTDAIKTDMAAIEVLLTAGNVDHAANEVLLTGIDADTNAMKVDLAAIEVLQTAANVDLAALEVLQTSQNALISTLDGVVDSILVKQAPVKTHQVLFSNVSIDGTSSEVSAAIDCRTIKHIAFFGQDNSESSCEIIFLACATSGGTYNAFHYSTKASGVLNNVSNGHTLPIFNNVPYSFIKVKISNGGSTSTFNMTASLSS